MEVLYSLLFIICFLMFLLGLINPKWALLWGKEKTRKKVGIYFGIPTMIFLILLGMTVPSDNSLEEKSTSIQNKNEEVISTTQSVEEDEKTSVLDNRGKVVSTCDYFPIKEKKSYIWAKEDEDNNISNHNWWKQHEGKIDFNDEEAYAISSFSYYRDPIDMKYYENPTKSYNFYEIDDDNNILKIGEKSSSGKIYLVDPPKVVLFSEMEIGKKYKIKEDLISVAYLKCIGFSDVNLPNGDIYNKCLVIDKIVESKKPNGELSFIYHFINYYAKNIGKVMTEVRWDNVENGVVKKGEIRTSYLLKMGYPEIIKEVYEYTPIEFLNLDKILKGFEELRFSIEKKNRDESGKEFYTIKNELVPDFMAILRTKDNKIEQISVIAALVGGNEPLLGELGCGSFLLTIKMFTGDDWEKVIEWITSEETIGNSVYVNGEETKSLGKIFNDIKITVSHINFSDVLAVLYFIEHKDGAKRKIIKIDPRDFFNLSQK